MEVWKRDAIMKRADCLSNFRIDPPDKYNVVIITV